MVRGVVLAALVALTGAAPQAPPASGWEEIAWPFPRDAWPAGKAYRCRDCDLEVYIRAKLGFCNCTTGVTDDAEVDAVSDVDMISQEFDAPAPGEMVEAAGLRGRARGYAVRMPDGTARAAVGFALSSKCDLLVAAGLGRDAADPARVAALLGSPPVAAWIAGSLGLPGLAM
jgi:hypothetical protein